jgi:DNA-binding NarL/FixJ family response regulator
MGTTTAGQFEQIPEAGGEDEPSAQTSQAIRIILADSQAIYRVGIRKVFALQDDIHVVAQVDSLDTLASAIQQFPSDIVLLESALLGESSDAIGELMRLAPQTKFIVQAVVMDESNTVELYRSGVRGIVPRSITPDLLIKCVRKIAQGETWIDNKSITWVIEAYRSNAAALVDPRSQPRLSPKEQAIIYRITQGKKNKEIALDMGTTEQVVKNYLRKIYDKLGVSDRLELALYCLHHQVLPHGATASSLEVKSK